jgi:DNA-binding response OmpR family regulator
MHSVLVADDDPAVLHFLRLALKASGFDVFEATTGVEAYVLIENNQPDVVILDLAMPVMGGRELFEMLKGRPNRPPVIILSAYGAFRACQELGAEDSLEKPFALEVLVSKVEALAGLPKRPRLG